MSIKERTVCGMMKDWYAPDPLRCELRKHHLNNHQSGSATWENEEPAKQMLKSHVDAYIKLAKKYWP